MNTFQSQEKDYGTEMGMLKRAPMSSSVHPLENYIKNIKQEKDKTTIDTATRNFGIGFALHLQHERAATLCTDIGHLGFLKRHNAMHQSLTGGDLDFDFTDSLNLEPEFNLPIHTMMEQKKSLFRK